jgi:hypothetical protein
MGPALGSPPPGGRPAVAPRYGLNLEVLQALREVWELPTEVQVGVTNPLGHREVYSADFNLVGGTSTLHEDRLGIMLADRGLYDVDLLEPMAREAQALGLRFGELLVRDKLLTRDELEDALRTQSAIRLQRMLGMPGLVTMGPGAERGSVAESFGGLVVEVFRNGLEAVELGPLVAQLESRRLRRTPSADNLHLLALLPAEAAFLAEHPLVNGEVAVEVALLPEAHLRLVCALFGLGVLERVEE